MSRDAVGRVIFCASSGQLAQIDVRHGPCIRRGVGGQTRPLVGFERQVPDPIASVEALCWLLTSREPASLAAIGSDGAGSLYALSDAFLQALARIYDESITDIDIDHPVTRPYREVAERWLASTPWRRGQTIDGLIGRLLGDVAEAVRARDRKIGLYCWSGPLILDEVLEDGRLTMRDLLHMRGELA